MSNIDKKVIEEFGEEWTKFDYSHIDVKKLNENFNQYFNIFPWDKLPKNAVGFDMGCGTGRWAQFVKVKTLNCIEPSDAIDVAKKNLIKNKNVAFFRETTENCSLNLASQDFGYCLRVLHHIPDTQKALKDCTRLLKPGAPILLYLYYSFENKPIWFKFLWKVSDYIRKFISISPKPVKHFLAAFYCFVSIFSFKSFGIHIRKGRA